jgi:hypothetical protein
MNLAYAELYLMLAGMFRRYGTQNCMMRGDKGRLELFDTDKRDVIPVAEYNIPVVWEGSQGVRIKILKVDV